MQILDKNGAEVGYDTATFKSNKLTLSITGGGTVIFNGVSNGDKININGTTRTIKSGTLS